MPGFYNKMLPYAQKASNALNIPVSVILGQWAIESGHGTSPLAIGSNNFAGITHVSSSIAIGTSETGKFAKYKDYNQFTEDYIRVMKLGYYDKVRNALGVQETATELGKSPYAGSHYGSTPGGDLLKIISTYGLTKYDTGMVTPSPTPTPTTPVLSYNDILNKVNNASPEDMRNMAIVGAGVLLIMAMVNK
jgi:flagellum-specific peptidoglycan hydrolase FlgJ